LAHSRFATHSQLANALFSLDFLQQKIQCLQGDILPAHTAKALEFTRLFSPHDLEIVLLPRGCEPFAIFPVVISTAIGICQARIVNGVPNYGKIFARKHFAFGPEIRRAHLEKVDHESLHLILQQYIKTGSLSTALFSLDFLQQKIEQKQGARGHDYPSALIKCTRRPPD
jgi:hypothetical protein